VKLIVVRGLIGVIACAGFLSIGGIFLSGGLAKFLKDYSQWDQYNWRGLLLILLGGLIVGVINGVLKAPVYLLVLGMLTVPVTTFVEDLMFIDMGLTAWRYLVWVTALLTTFVSALPTLIFWISRKGV